MTNYYSYLFSKNLNIAIDEAPTDKSIGELKSDLTEHKKTCVAKPGNCPYEKKVNAEIKKEEMKSENADDLSINTNANQSQDYGTFFKKMTELCGGDAKKAAMVSDKAINDYVVGYNEVDIDSDDDPGTFQMRFVSNGNIVDNGIGPYEFWGHKEVHHDYRVESDGDFSNAQQEEIDDINKKLFENTGMELCINDDLNEIDSSSDEYGSLVKFSCTGHLKIVDTAITKNFINSISANV